ncbi:MAG: formylmethanofuran dehydrogenase subunit C [Burkholderiales bacterium]
MNALTFTLRERPRQPVDMSLLTPDKLHDKSSDEIAALQLASGNRKLRVDQLFELAPGDTQQIVIRASCGKLNFVGKEMTQGSITVEGDAGAYAGMYLRGGKLAVSGNTGAYAATGMTAGLMHIGGSAGDFLAASVPGDTHGMRGGTVVVEGNCGDRAGDRMRRGVVLIRGASGSYCAARMLAGTIVVEGELGICPGLRMQRGTLLAMHALQLPMTFNDCGVHPFPFLHLLAHHLEALGHPLRKVPLRARRYLGDLATEGQGEILISA